MRRAGWLLGALLLCCASAHAQPSAFESMAQTPMPFVAPSGVVEKTLKFSDLTATLGQAETDITRPVSYENGKRRGEDRIVTYKARGMIFMIERDARKSMDPVVSTMAVTAPSRTVLPNGLAMGMPYAQALPIIERNYKLKKDFRKSSQPWFIVTDKAGDTDRTLHISFTDGKLSFMQFSTVDPPSFLQRLKRYIGTAFVLLLMFAVSWVVYQIRGGEDDEREPSPAYEAVRYGIAGLLLVGGIAMAAIGFPAFSSNDPYARFAALMALLAGLGGLFFGALILSGARNRVVSIIASSVILLVVIASVVGKFLH